MSALVEKMARAMASRLGAVAPSLYEDLAVVALKAMREPEINSAAIDAMNDVWVDAVEFQINVSMADCQTLFTAAIDAAIQEHSTTPPRNAS